MPGNAAPLRVCCKNSPGKLAAEFEQHFRLLRILHSLGDRLQVESLRHVEHGVDDRLSAVSLPKSCTKERSIFSVSTGSLDR